MDLLLDIVEEKGIVNIISGYVYDLENTERFQKSLDIINNSRRHHLNDKRTNIELIDKNLIIFRMYRPSILNKHILKTCIYENIQGEDSYNVKMSDIDHSFIYRIRSRILQDYAILKEGVRLSDA